jgi:uncharacterized coiled-coil DUF342 family protein
MSADESSTSFELARFEWVDPTRLEVEGTWNGVSRLRARATLVIEVDGRRCRLKALPGDTGTPEKWSAAFGWDGADIPRLQGAELEVGRGIVVDLPRPRSSKARAQLPKEPLPATTRDDKDAGPGRAEAERIIAALDSARAEAEEARETLARVRAERDELRAGSADLDALRAERDDLRARAEEADGLRAELEDLRARAAEAEELRPRAEEADSLRAEREELLRRAEDADELRSEQEGLRSEYQDLLDERDTLREEAQVLRARAAEADGLRDRLNEAAAKDIAPDVARLRAELGNVERERNELRAQLDSTSQRLEESTQAMAALTELDGEPPRRHDRPRRPAERTAKRAPEAEPAVGIADKVSDWVGSITGARDGDQGSKNGERHAATPTAVAPRTAAARRTAVRTAPHRGPESPSWLLRVAALLLLAFLLVTLVVILSSIL